MDCQGYTIIDTLVKGDLHALYRAKTDSNGKSVILKAFFRNFRDTDAVTCFHREYEVVRKLNHVSGIIHAYELIENAHSLVMVMEDINGASLKSYMTPPSWISTKCLISLFR